MWGDTTVAPSNPIDEYYNIKTDYLETVSESKNIGVYAFVSSGFEKLSDNVDHACALILVHVIVALIFVILKKICKGKEILQNNLHL